MKKKKIIFVALIIIICIIAGVMIFILNRNKNKNQTSENSEQNVDVLNENEKEVISILEEVNTFLNNFDVENNDSSTNLKNVMITMTIGAESKAKTIKEYVSQIYEVRKTVNNGIITYYIDAEITDKDDLLLKKRTIIKFLNDEIVGVNLNLGDINVLSKHFSDDDALTAYMMLKYVYNDTFNSVTEQINTEWQNATIIENVNYKKIWNNLYGVDENE